MNCQEAQQWIRCNRLFADGLGDGESAALAEHLLACPSCSTAMDGEEAFDGNIKSTMLDVPVPVDLQQKIYWELCRARRARQRSFALYASLAAAALLGIALSIGWYYQRPYDLALLQDMEQSIVQGKAAKFEPPAQGRERALAEWLQRQGIVASKPAHLKLEYLTAGYVFQVNGRKVVMLELNKPGSACRVYLLERKYFNENQYRELEQQGIASKIIADSNESTSLGWMVIDQGSASNFSDESLPPNGS